MITQKQLREMLNYCPETGVFTWVKPHPCSNKKHGDIAGHRHKKTGYISITINRKFNASHRLAWLYMTGEYPANEIDHINQNRSDNRWINLQDITTADNLKNKRLRKDNKSGISGVFFDRPSGKWEVKITSCGVKHYFGRYKHKKEAVKTRNKAIKTLGFSEIHGRY